MAQLNSAIAQAGPDTGSVIAHGPVKAVLGVDIAPEGRMGVLAETALDGAWLDQGDVNAGAGEFETQRVGHAFERVFRRGIGAAVAGRYGGRGPAPTGSTERAAAGFTSLTLGDDEGVKGASPTPGTVISAGKEGIVVATGEGALVVRSLQLEGKKRLDAAAFLAGTEVPVGTVLG